MRSFNLKTITAISLAASALFCSLAASALESDFDAPIDVQSESQFADMDADHITFEGNVVVHQGSIFISADRLDVFRENPGKPNQHTKLVAVGNAKKLAVYEQTMDDGARVHAEGLTLTYDLTIKFMEAKGKAFVKKQDNEIRADIVTYDMNKATMTAKSKKKEGNRVHTILLPEQLEEKKAPSSNTQKK